MSECLLYLLRAALSALSTACFSPLLCQFQNMVIVLVQVEMVIVIGKAGRRIPEDKAMEHVPSLPIS